MRTAALYLLVMCCCCASVVHVAIAQRTAQRSGERTGERTAQTSGSQPALPIASASATKAGKPWFAKYALPHNMNGMTVQDSLTALLQQASGKERVCILNALAEENRWLSFDRARLYQREALALAQSLNDEHGAANAVLNEAFVQRLTSQAGFGVERSNEALAAFRRIGDRNGEAKALYNLGLCYLSKGDVLRSRTYLLQSLKLADSIGNLFIAGRVNNAISEDYLDQGELDKSLNFALRSLDLHRRDSAHSSSAFWLVIQINNVGAVCYHRKEYPQALSYFFQALSIIQHHGMSLQHRLANSYANISQTYRLSERYAESLLWAKRAYYEQCYWFPSINHYHRRLLREFDGDVHRVLALAYRAAGQSDSALIVYKQILALPGAADFLTVEVHQEIAHLYNERGQGIVALRYARQARDSAERLGTLPTRVMAVGIMAESFATIRAFDSAYAYLQIYTRLHDSLTSIENKRQIERLQALQDLERQQLENISLRNENLEKEAVISRQTLVVTVVVGVLLLTVSLLALLYRANARNKRTGLHLRSANAQLDTTLRELQETQLELLETNTALEKKNVQLERLNTEKTELLSVVSHDLKNPLSAISGFTEIIADELPVEHSSQPLLGHILATVGRMSSLISNLLDSAAMELGNIKIRKQPVPLVLLVAGMIDRYTFAAEHKQQRFVTEISDEGSEVEVLGDREYLDQVFDNLVSNAVKYSPLGGTITVRVLTNTACGARVEIQDEGVGLSEEDKAKLFGFFQRLSSQPTGGESSNGVGLAVVKKIVELHEGTISCHSRKDEGIAGATFIVELPTVQR